MAATLAAELRRAGRDVVVGRDFLWRRAAAVRCLRCPVVGEAPDVVVPVDAGAALRELPPALFVAPAPELPLEVRGVLAAPWSTAPGADALASPLAAGAGSGSGGAGSGCGEDCADPPSAAGAAS